MRTKRNTWLEVIIKDGELKPTEEETAAQFGVLMVRLMPIVHWCGVLRAYNIIQPASGSFSLSLTLCNEVCDTNTPKIPAVLFLWNRVDCAKTRRDCFLEIPCSMRSQLFAQLSFPYQVILGGGRKMFRASKDEEGKDGMRKDGRDLIKDWQEARSKMGNASYVWNRQQLLSVMPGKTDFLLGENWEHTWRRLCFICLFLFAS